MNNRLARRVAAACGFFSILLGAFGAHALRSKLDAMGTLSFWQTAVLYHMIHSVVLLQLSSWRPIPKLAFHSIFYGLFIFSGSLYLLALTDIRWLGAITPLGGLGMLLGWFSLLFEKKENS
jgi:uncharacterized membrane protein YgdD (TMEM256/DUF423 family)